MSIISQTRRGRVKTGLTANTGARRTTAYATAKSSSCVSISLRSGYRSIRLTPKTSVIAYCRECTSGLNNPEKIEACQGDQAKPAACPLYPYRLGQKRVTVKVLRKFCLQCQGDSPGVKDCPSSDCPLYDFRYGTNPARKGTRNKGSFGRQWRVEPRKTETGPKKTEKTSKGKGRAK